MHGKLMMYIIQIMYTNNILNNFFNLFMKFFNLLTLLN